MHTTFHSGGFIAPMDKDSFCSEDSGLVEGPVRVDYLQVDREMIVILYREGIIDTINNSCGALIDEYEKECLTPDKLFKVIPSLNLIKTNICNESGKRFVEKLIDLMERAMLKGFPVFVEF